MKICFEVFNNFSLCDRYEIEIIDCLGKICFNDYCLGKCFVNLDKGFYKVYIKMNCYIRCFGVFVNDNMYIPIFFQNKKRNPLITFYLTDQNYEGLKIERGEITLWQNHIQ